MALLLCSVRLYVVPGGLTLALSCPQHVILSLTSFSHESCHALFKVYLIYRSNGAWRLLTSHQRAHPLKGYYRVNTFSSCIREQQTIISGSGTCPKKTPEFPLLSPPPPHHDAFDLQTWTIPVWIAYRVAIQGDQDSWPSEYGRLNVVFFWLRTTNLRRVLPYSRE